MIGDSDRVPQLRGILVQPLRVICGLVLRARDDDARDEGAEEGLRDQQPRSVVRYAARVDVEVAQHIFHGVEGAKHDL